MSGRHPNKINMALSLTNSWAGQQTLSEANPSKFPHMSQIQHLQVCNQICGQILYWHTQSTKHANIFLSLIGCSKLWVSTKYQITKNRVLVFLVESYVYLTFHTPCVKWLLPCGLLRPTETQTHSWASSRINCLMSTLHFRIYVFVIKDFFLLLLIFCSFTVNLKSDLKMFLFCSK